MILHMRHTGRVNTFSDKPSLHGFYVLDRAQAEVSKSESTMLDAFVRNMMKYIATQCDEACL